MCPHFKLGVNLKSLPCGGCFYCERAYEKWGNFVRDVDDVVPLAQKPKVASVSINCPEECIQVSHLTVARASDSTTLVRSNGEERAVRVVSEPSGSSIDLGGYTEEQLREKQEQDQISNFSCSS